MVIVVFAGFLLFFMILPLLYSQDGYPNYIGILAWASVPLGRTAIAATNECPPIESLISDISNPMRIIAKSHW